MARRRGAMSALGDQVARYLAVRRALGYSLKEHERLLACFLAYLDSLGLPAITVADAVVWARQAGSEGQAARRLSVVRRFAVYLSGFHPATAIPASRLLPYGIR